MSTVKISELIELPAISANTSNTLFLGVDLPSQVTGRFTATTLAQQLYANNYLNVGNHSAILPNAVAQFAGESNNYIQVSIQNDRGNGSSDYVITGDNGTDSTNYIDMGFAGSTYNYPGYTVYKPSDGYLLVQGGTDSSTHGGNLVMGVVTQDRDIVFFQGGSTDANVVAKFSYGNGFKLTQKPIIFADSTTQNTAASPANYSQAAFALANTNSNSISTLTVGYQAVFDFANTTANTTTNSITYIAGVNSAQNTYASAAFAKANAALANATGTFAGDLTITGNTYAQKVNTANLQVIGTANISGTLGVTGIVSMNAQLILTNTNFSATESAITISGNPLVQLPSNDGYMMHISGKQNVSSRIVADSFGANTYVVFAGRSARGTYSAPSALANGDIMMRISGNGYGSTQYAQFGSARIDFVAAENWTDSARGSQIKMYNCVNGSNTITEIAAFNADSVVFTGVVKPERGFIYTPRLPVGAQTAITIDYSTDSMIKANCAADVTISHSNFVAGKVVEMWLVNTGGLARTVTHGISALNSTTNSTTFSIPGTSSAYMRFFSIDGDLGNTFVNVVHA